MQTKILYKYESGSILNDCPFSKERKLFNKEQYGHGTFEIFKVPLDCRGCTLCIEIDTKNKIVICDAKNLED